MIPVRSLSPYLRPGRLVLLLALSLLLISAAPYPQGPVLYPPPLAPVGPLQPAVESAAPPQSAIATTCTHCLYLPAIHYTPDSFNRAAIYSLYKNEYLAPLPAVGWTGSLTTDPNKCNPGDISQSFRAAVLRRINFYRTMAGVPPVKAFNATYNQQNQEAAYMMAVNKDIQHNPPDSWICDTANARTAAGSSNLAMGLYGPDAIHLYIDDGGLASMGHRRWVLYPQTQEMGTGDVPGTGSDWHSVSNVMKAWDSHYGGPRPVTTRPYVAWPPPGYVPFTVINDYWSFAYPGADFSSTGVSVTQGSTPLAITKYAQVNGYGDNTLVWKINSVNGDWPQPPADATYTVTVTNVAGQNFTYQVIVFDPGP